MSLRLTFRLTVCPSVPPSFFSALFPSVRLSFLRPIPPSVHSFFRLYTFQSILLLPSFRQSVLLLLTTSVRPSILWSVLPPKFPFVHPLFVLLAVGRRFLISVLPSVSSFFCPNYRPSTFIHQFFFLSVLSPSFRLSNSPSALPSEFPSFLLFSFSIISVRPSLRPIFCPSFCPSIFPSFSPSGHPSFRPPFHPSFRLSVYPPFRPFDFPVSPSVHHSIRPSFAFSVCPPFSFSPSFRPCI